MIAQEIYESTKGIGDEIPRHTSKILQNVKGDKKSKGGASAEPVKFSKYEAWEKMYRDKLEEYKAAKARTEELTNRLHEKNDMYITREETYNKVIDELLQKKKENSTHPLAVVDDKINDEDDLLLNGIDIHDREEAKKIERRREIQKKNAQLMDNQFRGNSIRELTNNLEEVKKEIGEAQIFIATKLKDKRGNILESLDKRVQELEDQLRAEA